MSVFLQLTGVRFASCACAPLRVPPCSTDLVSSKMNVVCLEILCAPGRWPVSYFLSWLLTCSEVALAVELDFSLLRIGVDLESCCSQAQGRKISSHSDQGIVHHDSSGKDRRSPFWYVVCTISYCFRLWVFCLNIMDVSLLQRWQGNVLSHFLSIEPQATPIVRSQKFPAQNGFVTAYVLVFAVVMRAGVGPDSRSTS